MQLMVIYHWIICVYFVFYSYSCGVPEVPQGDLFYVEHTLAKDKDATQNFKEECLCLPLTSLLYAFNQAFSHCIDWIPMPS